jgi:hypothetical protein
MMTDRKRERNRNRNVALLDGAMLVQEASFIQRLPALVAAFDTANAGERDDSGCECDRCAPPHTLAPPWWW